MVLTVIAESISVIAIDAATDTKALVCEEVVAGSVSSRPPRPRRRVYGFTTEARLELIGMFALRKAEDGHVDIILTIRVATPAD